MTLGLALNSAVTGLKTNQRALGVLSHNIANANTEGYSRQILQQEAVYADGIGQGVRINDVVRNIDKYLSRSILSQSSVYERSDVLTEYHERMQILFGEPGSNNTLDEYVTDFFAGLQQLAETPERTSFRSNAINSGVTLAREVSDLAFKLEDLRYQADRDISEGVNAVNNIIQQLNAVNVAMASASVLGQSRAGLEDQRDGLLRQLAGRMDISTFFESTGAVSVYVGNGTTLLGDGVRRELRYSPAVSADSFANDGVLSSLQVISYDNSGRELNNPTQLISGTTSTGITSTITGGSFAGLQEVRDVLIPEIISQLDTLAGALRDEVNKIHNDGVGYPPAQSLTGTRTVTSGDQFNWSGKVRIAALQANGNPVPAGFADESETGWRPLNLDLSFLDSGNGPGRPTVQTIIDEINNHFRAPSIKTSLGNMNNIQLVSDSTQLPSVPTAEFRFDLDLENISDGKSTIFITNTTVLNNVGTNITNITQNVPSFTIDPVNSYSTTIGSNSVTVRLNPPIDLAVGDDFFLQTPPAGLYNGIPAASLGGYFKVSGITGSDVTFTLTSSVVATGAGFVAAGAGLSAIPAYDTIDPGEKRRTRDTGGIITADLTLDTLTPYYDISLDVGVVEPDGSISLSTITYRVTNQSFNLLNDRYDSTAATAPGTRTTPSTTQDALRAVLVDADGNELPRINGQYVDTQEGFLRIVGGTAASHVGIDELDSSQLGLLTTSPTEPGTNRGFSHYFELNNFFQSNKPTTKGDTLRGSAYHMAVEQRIIDNPNLISTGELVATAQPTDPDDAPQYTYERQSGDNSVAQRLANAGLLPATFEAAGGLPDAELTFVGYAGEFLGYVASQSAAATSEQKSAQILLDGYKERADVISNVNLDEELASTIVYQNAYSASARVVSVVNELFSDLLGLLG